MSKVYLGNGKKMKDTWFKGYINLDKAGENATVTKSGNRIVKININVLDAPDQYGNDISITLDDYEKAQVPAQVKAQDKDDLPF